ncbi:septum site-determining protein MinC [Acidihalobacter ferrooxydans]|uniref:Probable septum site-determining protein MinC n=1 Tax=Acidihalobacter ferrooxydans TaxID=1765967 RepID=A0A1P8UJG1_9GAMM|nr:septum site-determining protein MinC [Acidihalobacter ferrooxydans]APZ43977.1 hypothetical protein BW247_13480 [Acidihalobacter ferrooxydans]
MSAPAHDRTGAAPAFELKGSRFTLSVLNLRSTDLNAIGAQLAATVAQAPGFLAQAPVVLEPATGLDTAMLDLTALADLLRTHGLIPVGLRGGDDALRQRAQTSRLALLGEGGMPAQNAPASTTAPAPASTPASAPVAASRAAVRVQDRPVRSGQQVYAAGGDLVVLGAVSAGAEVIADGSIHVYGALRGRALAGARGDESAHIFCQAMEAELLSIAGCYRLFEEADPTLHGHTAHVHLNDDRLLVDAL